jgi:carboxylesterase type B
MSNGEEVIKRKKGMKEKVMDMSWVKKKIEKFGGHNDKVKILGERDGGDSVNYILL